MIAIFRLELTAEKWNPRRGFPLYTGIHSRSSGPTRGQCPLWTRLLAALARHLLLGEVLSARGPLAVSHRHGSQAKASKTSAGRKVLEGWDASALSAVLSCKHCIEQQVAHRSLAHWPVSKHCIEQQAAHCSLAHWPVSKPDSGFLPS